MNAASLLGGKPSGRRRGGRIQSKKRGKRKTAKVKIKIAGTPEQVQKAIGKFQQNGTADNTLG